MGCTSAKPKPELKEELKKDVPKISNISQSGYPGLTTVNGANSAVLNAAKV